MVEVESRPENAPDKFDRPREIAIIWTPINCFPLDGQNRINETTCQDNL